MALTPERYRELDAELERMWTRLIEIAVEIERAAPATNKQGFTYQAAYRAGDAVALMRHMLDQEQEHARMGEEIRRRLYGTP